MEVAVAQSDQDLARIAPVLLELRNRYDTSSLIEQIKRQQQQYGYQVAFVEADGAVLCVAGFVITEKLAWERHLYVDDLITSAARRSSGAGKCMMDWLKQHAIDQGCKQLHLDSGVQRFAAHKFYLREGLVINSHHFAIPTLDGH